MRGPGLNARCGACAESAPVTAAQFSDLGRWNEVEAGVLLEGLRRHLTPDKWLRRHQAMWLPSVAKALSGLRGNPKDIVEELFAPIRVEKEGFLTGYYEPVIPASRQRTPEFSTPIHRRPPDLVRVTPPRSDFPGDGSFARVQPGGTLVPYPDRGAIRRGAIDGLGLELAFVADPVDAFFAHVQGSARLAMENGETVRIGYHGKTGHAYTPIGRVLIERGLLPSNAVTMESIRAVLAERPELVPDVLDANRSYIFFRERECAGADAGPVAAGGVPLIPWRSLAVDRRFIPLGTPVFIETEIPGHGSHAGVAIAEDTGSAILGPSRADLFFGSGDAAGRIAGAMKGAARLTLIVPKDAIA